MTAVQAWTDTVPVVDALAPVSESDLEHVLELERQVASLREGLTSSRHIGMAMGLLAHRFGCTTDQAWLLLKRLSQYSNTKVRDIARVLVESFDGHGRPEDAAVRAVVASQLPSGGWPGCGDR